MRRKKIMSKFIALGIIGGITFSSCVGSQIDKASALTSTKKVSTTAVTTIKKTKTATQKNITYLDYNQFTLLKDAKLPCKFTSTAGKVRYEKPYSIKGSYDLNKDGKKDKIKIAIDMNNDDLNVTLNINGKIRKDYINAPGDAYIVDLDKNDSYVDLVLYDDGMSGDPAYHFYRYNGKSIQYLSAFCTIRPGAVAFDGHNHVAAKDSFLGDLNTPMLKGYATLNKNLWKYHKFNLNKAEHKTYTLTRSTTEGFFGAYFIETRKNPDDVEYFFDKKYQIKLRKGDNITINKIDKYERYQVKLPDGRVGMLYFWIGD